MYTSVLPSLATRVFVGSLMIIFVFNPLNANPDTGPATGGHIGFCTKINFSQFNDFKLFRGHFSCHSCPDKVNTVSMQMI